MRGYLILLAWVTLMLPTWSQQKNVLLLISDNQTWHDCGCYGNPVVQTPHIDQLAADGVRFEHAFATTASCGPSRAVIYSGLLTHSNGQYAHPHREHNQQLRPEVTTVFQMLKSNGYRTGLIGKDHIKPLEKYPIDFKPRIQSRDVIKMAASADEFLAEGDEPFFLVMSFHDPHPTSLDGTGWGITKSSRGYDPVNYDPAKVVVPGFLPDTPEVRESIAGYYQQITRMDHGVGLALDSLKKAGKADDTLVIFIADHGTSEPGAMGTHYEPGVRVPFVVRQPGGPKGAVNPALVAFTDITPTILDWTDSKFDDYPLQGRSILPVIAQPTTPDWDYAFLSHVGHDVFAYYPMRTIRGQRYKLIWNVTWQAEYPLPIDTFQRRLWAGIRARGEEKLGPRTVEQYLHRPILELYDLREDPWETQNLAEDPAHAETRQDLVDRLMQHLEKTSDPWIRKYHPDRPSQQM